VPLRRGSRLYGASRVSIAVPRVFVRPKQSKFHISAFEGGVAIGPSLLDHLLLNTSSHSLIAPSLEHDAFAGSPPARRSGLSTGLTCSESRKGSLLLAIPLSLSLWRVLMRCPLAPLRIHPRRLSISPHLPLDHPCFHSRRGRFDRVVRSSIR